MPDFASSVESFTYCNAGGETTNGVVHLAQAKHITDFILKKVRANINFGKF
jgi:hypothetical protein